MAFKGRVRGLCGFEQYEYGTNPSLFIDTNVVRCDGSARSGRGYARCIKRLGTTGVNNCYIYPRREEGVTTISGLSVGDYVQGRVRFWMRINSIDGSGAVFVGGLGYTSVQYDARGMEIDPATMKWRIGSFGTSAYSANALPLGEWLQVDVHLQGRSGTAGTINLTITCNGETLTASPGTVGLTPLAMPALFDNTGTTVAFNIDVDDLAWWCEADSAGYVDTVLPSATHIKLCKFRYYGQTEVWDASVLSSVYHARRIEDGASDYLGPSTAGQVQPIYFQTPAELGGTGIEAIDIGGVGQSSGTAEASADVFGLETVALDVSTALTVFHFSNFSLTDDLLTNSTLTLTSVGTGTFQIKSMWAYVACTVDLDPPEEGAGAVSYSDYWTSGTSIARDPFAAIAGTYNGSGDPQKITLPYEPVAVIIREINNANYTRCVVAIDKLAGTSHGYWFGETLDGAQCDLVQDMLSDGFVVGKHLDTSGVDACNRPGSVYEYLAIFDQGGGQGGRLAQTIFVNANEYPAGTTQIPVSTEFEPGLILVSRGFGSYGIIWASPWGYEINVDTQLATSGYIANVSPTGFVLTSNIVSLLTSNFGCVAFHKDLLNKFFSAGTYVGTGAVKAVATEDLAKKLFLIQSPPRSSTRDCRYWVPAFGGPNLSASWTQTTLPTSDTTRIRSVSDASFEVGTQLSVLGRTYHWFALHEYQQETVQGSGFPASKTLIVSPTRGTNLSDGKTVTLDDGTLFNSAYPLSNLTDGKGRTVCRLSTNYGRIVIDLGAAHSPDLLAVVNHNLDDGLVLGVLGSNNSDMSSPSLVGGIAATKDPVIWIDLRGFAFSPSRYWSIEVTEASPNSVGLTFGEIIIATADAFDGIIDPDHEAVWKTFRERSFTEYGLPYSMSSGAIQRALRLGLTLFTDDMDTIEEIFDDAGTNGERVLVIPDSRIHEAYFVEWASQLDRTRENEWIEKGSLELLEESFGVVHKGLT